MTSPKPGAKTNSECKVRESRKSLSEKTQKLIQTTKTISETLLKLDSKKSLMDEGPKKIKKIANNSNTLAKEDGPKTKPEDGPKTKPADGAKTKPEDGPKTKPEDGPKTKPADNVVQPAETVNIFKKSPAEAVNIVKKSPAKPVESITASTLENSHAKSVDIDTITPNPAPVASVNSETMVIDLVPHITDAISKIIEPALVPEKALDSKKASDDSKNTIKSDKIQPKLSRASSTISKKSSSFGKKTADDVVATKEPSFGGKSATSLQKLDVKETTHLESVKENVVVQKKILKPNNEAPKEEGPSKADITLLLSKIQHLEGQLVLASKSSNLSPVSPAQSTGNIQSDSIKRQNHELQMRVSRQELEMKALLEQNDILRTENRRISELEYQLQLRVFELSQPKQPKHPQVDSILDPSDIVSQERIIQQLDEQIGRLAAHYYQAKEKEQDGKHLETFQDCFESLKKVVRSISTGSPKALLSACKLVAGVACDSMAITSSALKESQNLGSRLDKLKSESISVGLEATETIQKLNVSHEQKIQTLEGTSKKLKTQLAGITEKYQQLQEQNELLSRANQKLAAKNQYLIPLAERPDAVPEVAIFSDPQAKATIQQIEALNERNNSLQVHIDHLSSTIESWKNENSLLLQDVTKLRDEKSQLERDAIKHLEKIAELDNLVKDEKLTSSKAAELIKSLQQDLENAQKKPVQYTIPDTRGPAVADDESLYEQQVLKFLKDSQEKSKRISELESDLKEQIGALQRIEDENAKLKLKQSQSKDKFTVREAAWLEKLRKFRDEQESISKECAIMKEYLRSYQDQFISILALEDKALPLKEPVHPIGFAPLFNALHNRTQKVTEMCLGLETQLRETKAAFEATSKDLVVQIKQFEILGHESNATREKLVHMSNEKSKLFDKVQLLEQNVERAITERNEAKERLKLVVGRMAEYVQIEME